MKYVILYSRAWAKKREELIKKLREECEKLNVIFINYDNYIIDKQTLMKIIEAEDDGFDDIVKNTLVKDIQKMTIKQCIDWIFKDMDNHLTSIICISINDKNEFIRVENGLPNVEYMISIIKWRESNLK